MGELSITFRPAVRENVPLLLGIAGGTGAGKTWTAMTLAKGMSGGKRFAVLDTENGRAKHYADDFDFDHADLHAPFRPDAYAEAITTADAAGYGVVVVDSMSHEWAGDGGILDWQEEEFQRLGGREAMKMASWIKPKMSHRKFVTRLLQVRAHVILCFRASERVEMVRNAQGKMEVVPKRSLTGLDGWIPITEKDLPFELTLSVLLTADAPGVPKPIKLQSQHRPLVPLDRPIDEVVGKALAAWAAGGAAVEEGLSVEAFSARAAELGVERAVIAEAGRRLFAGRSAASLSGVERQVLLDEVTPEPEPEPDVVAVHDFGVAGPTAEEFDWPGQAP